MKSIYWVLLVCPGLGSSQFLFYLICSITRWDNYHYYVYFKDKNLGLREVALLAKSRAGIWVQAGWFQSLYHTALSNFTYSRILRHLIPLTMISRIFYLYVSSTLSFSWQMDLGWLKKDKKSKYPLNLSTYVLIPLYYWQRYWNKSQFSDIAKGTKLVNVCGNEHPRLLVPGLIFFLLYYIASLYSYFKKSM